MPDNWWCNCLIGTSGAPHFARVEMISNQRNFSISFAEYDFIGRWGYKLSVDMYIPSTILKILKNSKNIEKFENLGKFYKFEIFWPWDNLDLSRWSL